MLFFTNEMTQMKLFDKMERKWEHRDPYIADGSGSGYTLLKNIF